MNVRVVFLTTTFDEVSNGPGIFARYLWDAFRDDPDIEFHVVAPTFQEKHPRLHASGHSPSSRDLYNRACRLAVQVAEAGGARSILHSNGAHFFETLGDYSGIILAHINDYRVAEIWQNVPSTLYRYGLRTLLSILWRYRQEAHVMRSPAYVISNSEYTRQRLLSCYTCDPSRVLTIYKGVNASIFARPQKLPLPPDPLPERPAGARLVTIGSNWRLKGVPELLAALALVRRTIPHVHLTVGGPHRPRDLADLNRLVRRHDIVNQVSFPGLISREQLPAVLWHSDLFVTPTRVEALGVAIIEAMAAGLPVIANRVGGIPEIIRSPDEGVLTEAGDISALASSIVSLLSDETRQKALRRIGPVRAAEFSVDKMVARVRNLYVSLS